MLLMLHLFTKAEAETDTNYFWASLLTDAIAGAATVTAIIPIGLALGGFSFIEPWLIVTPVMLFAVGFLRGFSPGSAWAKAVTLSASAWLVILLTANGPAAMLVGMSAATLLPAMGGVTVRRYQMKSRTNR